MKLLKLLGSIQFAIFLIAALAILLATSTLIESVHGTVLAQKIFYRAGWFNLFLSLLWVNIFCSTLTRFPFKKHHTGFVITHIGILVLLVGALLSRLLGVEGEMSLLEGESRGRITQEGHALNISAEGAEPISVELKDVSHAEGEIERSVPIFENRDFNILLHRVFENAQEKLMIREGSDPEAPNRAVQVSWISEAMGFNHTFWLIENDPQNPHSSFASMGPAFVELKTHPSDPLDYPTLRIFKKSGELISSLPLTDDLGEEIALEGSPLKISDLKYYPHAKISNNKLINSPEDVPFNPAVEFEIVGPEGKREHHTKFALFPQLESLHGGQAKNIFDLTVALEAPIPEELQNQKSPSLTIDASPEGQWRYRITSSKGTVQEGSVQLHNAIPTGWMDIHFRVDQMMNHALLSRQIEKTEGGGAGVYAAEVSLIGQGDHEQREWILEGRQILFATEKEPVEIALRPKTAKLPFVLQLLDFRRMDYPGTQKPAAFESDVILYDHKENVTIQKTISMNKPLDYAGYRIFQASYIQDPERGEGSVFTIAKNPGIGLIYSGAVILFTGVIFLFYIKPFSRENARNGD